MLEPTVAEQGSADDDEDEADPADPAAAVVFAPCVELLEPSPGNCTAACGSLDGEALMPGAAPADPCPVVTEPDANEPDVNELDPLADPVPADVVMSDEPSSHSEPAETEPPQDAAVPVVVPPNEGVNVGVIVLDDIVVAELLVPSAVFCETPGVCEAP